ncbi:MAG: DNA methyltransferase [Planctomycetota bacterium]
MAKKNHKKSKSPNDTVPIVAETMPTYAVPPNDLECTTVWSFPVRGEWATHNASYRGNWAPQIPRNLILRYTKEGDTVLDQMMGAGTTLVECRLLNRKGIGIDINPDSIRLAQKHLTFTCEHAPSIVIRRGDARDLSAMPDASVDLIATHPPYVDIVKYSEGKILEDLSNIHDVKTFCDELERIAQECFRVLKPNKFCAILMGDTRRKGFYIPLAYRVLERFLKVGFVLKEDVIKAQHNCRMTGYWRSQSQRFNFLLIMHEHLFIFKKP